MKDNILFSKTTFQCLARRLKVYFIPISILLLMYSISSAAASDNHVLTSEGPPNTRPTK